MNDREFGCWPVHQTMSAVWGVGGMLLQIHKEKPHNHDDLQYGTCHTTLKRVLWNNRTLMSRYLNDVGRGLDKS